MLAQRGVWFTDANRDHKSGWAKVRSMLDRKLLYVRQGAAPNLMRTLPNLVRDPKKPDDLARGGTQVDARGSFANPDTYTSSYSFGLSYTIAPNLLYAPAAARAARDASDADVRNGAAPANFRLHA